MTPAAGPPCNAAMPCTKNEKPGTISALRFQQLGALATHARTRMRICTSSRNKRPPRRATQQTADNHHDTPERRRRSPTRHMAAASTIEQMVANHLPLFPFPLHTLPPRLAAPCRSHRRPRRLRPGRRCPQNDTLVSGIYTIQKMNTIQPPVYRPYRQPCSHVFTV